MIDKPSFNTAVAVAFERLPVEGQRRRLLATSLTGLLAVLVAAVFVLILVWNHTNSLLINGVAVTGLGLAVPLTTRAIIRTIRA